MNWSLVQMDGVWQKQRGEKKKGSVARSQEQEPSRRMGSGTSKQVFKKRQRQDEKKKQGTEDRCQDPEPGTKDIEFAGRASLRTSRSPQGPHYWRVGVMEYWERSLERDLDHHSNIPF
jgi:hypothetical protein